jgi:hypothetical protein
MMRLWAKREEQIRGVVEVAQRIPDGERTLAVADHAGDCRLRVALLDAFDRQRQVDLAACLVARHLTLGYPPKPLIATLARALMREDAGFHSLREKIPSDNYIRDMLEFSPCRAAVFLRARLSRHLSDLRSTSHRWRWLASSNTSA